MGTRSRFVIARRTITYVTFAVTVPDSPLIDFPFSTPTSFALSSGMRRLELLLTTV